MTRRYYTPDLMIQYPTVELPDDEAAHAVRVMRVRVGDRVELFDGRGNQSAATVISASRRECVCESEIPEPVEREPDADLELAIALPKPDRAKEMIERLTELGVTQVQPLVFGRTQRPPTDSVIGKLERIVIEACKQSGRNQLMTIAPVMRFGKWIGTQEPSRLDNHRHRYVAMPGGRAMSDVLNRVSQNGVEPSWLWVIGPEGGLTDGELAACQAAGMEPIDLGKRILRVETAACMIASRFLWD